jgi:hypothetical protein
MYFWQEEEVHDCFLVVVGYTPDLDSPTRVETLALITGVGCVQSVFGYPNEDAYFKDPRGAMEWGCYEIEGSGWIGNLQEYNRRSFGTDLPISERLHHYFIGSKDGSCQILARTLEVEVFPELSFQEVVSVAKERVRGRFLETLRQIREMQEKGPT